MLTSVAGDQEWPDVVAEISARFSKFAFVFLLYNKALNDWSLGEQSTARYVRSKISGENVYFSSV